MSKNSNPLCSHNDKNAMKVFEGAWGDFFQKVPPTRPPRPCIPLHRADQALEGGVALRGELERPVGGGTGGKRVAERVRTETG